MYILEFYNYDSLINYYIDSEKPISKTEFKEKLLNVFNDILSDDSKEICANLPYYYTTSHECDEFKQALKRQGLYLAKYTKESLQEYTTLSAFKTKLKNDIILEKITKHLKDNYSIDASYTYEISMNPTYNKPFIEIETTSNATNEELEKMEETASDIIFDFCRENNYTRILDTLKVKAVRI